MPQIQQPKNQSVASNLTSQELSFLVWNPNLNKFNYLIPFLVKIETRELGVIVGELSFSNPKWTHYRSLGPAGLNDSPSLNEPSSTSLEFNLPQSKDKWA